MIRIGRVAIVAVGVLFAAGCGEGGGGPTRTADTCEGEARTAAELLADLPSGWRLGPSDRAMADSVAAEGPRGDRRRVTARRVEKGRAGATLIVLELRDPAYADGVMSGMKEEAGTAIQDVQLGGTRGTLHEMEDGGALVLGRTERCTAAMLLADKRELAEELARELPAEPEETPDES